VALVSGRDVAGAGEPKAAPPESEGGRVTSRFERWSHAAASGVGHPAAFLAAVVFVLAWAVAGPLFGFSEAWQLVINTTTTILTFLMIFLLQNSQNRDTDALQLKLDEVIRALEGARNSMVDVEHLDDEQRARLRKSFEALAESSRGKESAGAVGAEAGAAGPREESR
jgi:low affinity Fe/Cu permease